MGCDYYQSTYVEYTYTIGNDHFIKKLEIDREKKWIHPEKDFKEELEKVLNEKYEVIYTEKFPIDLKNKIIIKVKEDHNFNLLNTDFINPSITELDIGIYFKISRLLGENPDDDFVKYNFLKLFNLKKIRWYSYCWI